MTLRFVLLLALACLAACDSDRAPAESAVPDDAPEPAIEGQSGDQEPAADGQEGAQPAYLAVDDGPSVGDILPLPFRVIWEPWHGDFEGMVERRIVRAVVPFGGYQFYYEDGFPKGASYDLLQRLESHINTELGRRNIKVYVVVIPVSRDQLIPT